VYCGSTFTGIQGNIGNNRLPRRLSGWQQDKTIGYRLFGILVSAHKRKGEYDE